MCGPIYTGAPTFIRAASLSALGSCHHETSVQLYEAPGCSRRPADTARGCGKLCCSNGVGESAWDQRRSGAEGDEAERLREAGDLSGPLPLSTGFQ